MKIRRAVVTLTISSFLSAGAGAVTPGEVARLGQDLTSVGAEKAANHDGSIPAFGGVDKPAAGWTYGKLREEYWTHKAEKPLFVIDASNVDKYADKLSAGQIETLKKIKGYTMPVYPTHRNCAVPDFVEKNTKDSALKAAIGKDQWSLESASLPSVPFPIPKDGIQVMWNWLVHYMGVGIEWPGATTYVSPRPGSDIPIVAEWNQIQYYPWAKPGGHSPQDEQGLMTAFYYGYLKPASLAGQALIQRFYYTKKTDSFYYFTGQRRVRRLPAYSYDAPLIGFENQYPADTTWVFTGSPDRFTWKLIGKKEVYVPYNSYAMQRFDTKVSTITGPMFIDPKMRRYELHRMWEIEGTVKEGERHATPKKTLYIDEDSWIVSIGDDYDTQGKIWKSKENFITPEWEINSCAPSASIYTDLQNGRYVFDMSTVGLGKDMRFYPPEYQDKRLMENFYTSESLGATSDR
ncbi:DUF1329 domain-containing protein [Glaciimonas sp. PCH181]|uniref:DUF1329 domain-containing protein n=1 Tax=Glaciimonas sp. PCH181 TaxID=2133943 RepID=UPI000D3CFB3D|nr:DUF1329 domain-containing protein [Glaciimonas sp. PCH181]PUA19706.1 DUF1329 domain-containing protein [Glaciimonas sp. PCH181]